MSLKKQCISIQHLLHCLLQQDTVANMPNRSHQENNKDYIPMILYSLQEDHKSTILLNIYCVTNTSPVPMKMTDYGPHFYTCSFKVHWTVDMVIQPYMIDGYTTLFRQTLFRQTLFRQSTVRTSGCWLQLNRLRAVPIGKTPDQIPKIRGSTIVL